jgi:acetyl esterase/lipase
VQEIAYGADPHQCLDLYVPNQAAAGPLVVFVHGGGWSVGDKAIDAALGTWLAAAGFVVALTNYRLSPAVQHPAHVEDVAQAIGWCHRHAARYGADPERLYLIGHSSGAQLAALVTLDPRYLAAQELAPTVVRRVILIAGIGYDVHEGYATPELAPFLVPVFGPAGAGWVDAAPLTYVSNATASYLLIHGLDDTDAPPAGTHLFGAALESAGVPTQVVLLPGAEHVSVMKAAAPFVLTFLQAP